MMSIHWVNTRTRLGLIALSCSAALLLACFPANAQRAMESLGRGVVAVRSSNTQVFVSWRLLGLDPEGIGFNVYRSANGGSFAKLNATVLTSGTNYTDATANLSQANTYHVRPVIGGVEQAASGAFTLTANHAIEPVVRMPLRAGGPVKFVWVGDLDGDGEYDFVLDRQTTPQKIEAYRRNGQLLWEVDMGPNSTEQDNIEGGSSTIDVGHNDGVTVFDFDSDGRAEVAVRIANGVRFGNGSTFTNSNNNLQFAAILDGMTGALRATAQIPTDYIADGPMYARFGVGYLNGTTPSLVAYMKNRIGSGDFNLMICAWSFNGSALTQQWKWLRGNQDAPDGHNTRIVDVDQNGTDEIAEIGFVLNSNGTLRYSLGPRGVIHGDRFHIAKMDPGRAGLQGYGVQQDNPTGLLEYYYDASNGNLIWQHFGAVSDVGRGMAGDIDPRFPGMEVWSFSGLYNASRNQLAEPNTTLRPWPHLGLWWDGDITMELLNNGKFEKWDPANPTTTSTLPRLLTISNYGAVGALGNTVNPPFVGDILGDWREEVVYTNAAFNELIIFTTNIASSTRLYTLPHNPEYRNGMTLKGYVQSHHVDYFLGNGMAPPPRPNIRYVGTGSPSGGTVQAESAVLAGGTVVENDRSGYNGAGFVNFPVSGGSAQFNSVSGGNGGSRQITFRYANGAATARTGRLVINGAGQDITFASTGGWTNWALLTTTVSLNAGTSNTIRLESNGQDLANLDELTVP
jgi:rhamnogalacturonan endolyase